jgi:lysyl-tRNA synthetase class I
MSHNYTSQCESLYTNLRRTQKTLSVLAESNRAWAESYCALAESYRALAESHRSVLEEKEAQDETIKDQQQVIDDLNRKLDCQPNYCENDGSSNCAMSRSRICYG